MLINNNSRILGTEIILPSFSLNLYKTILLVIEISRDNLSLVNLQDEDEDDFDDDDDYYKEDENDKGNPFEREPDDDEIDDDDDFPHSIPEDDLLDDDEEIPYN